MNIFKSGMLLLKKMKTLDVVVFKFYLISIGQILPQYVGFVAQINPKVYLGIAIVSVLFLLTKFKLSTSSTASFTETKLKEFHALNMLDVSVFKTAFVCIGISAYAYIPFFQSLASGRYKGIFVF